MITLLARKLMDANVRDLWHQLTDYYMVQFDDATIQMHGTDIILSWYLWKFIRRDPKLPLLSKYTVIPYYKSNLFTTGTMRAAFNPVLWDTYDAYDQQVPVHDLMEIIQYMNMYLYNHAVEYTSAFVTGLTIVDYIDLLYHPLLVELKEECARANHSMGAVEVAIKKATKLMTSGLLVDKNGKLLAIPKSCMAGVIKPPQAVQATFMRGTVPDIKMESIPYPITRSLVEGMATPLDYAILSREGAIAEMASMSDLQTVCYNGRKLALVGQGKQTVTRSDCGSTNYLYWTVSEPTVVNGKVTHPSDLSSIEGMWYLPEGETQLRQITMRDTHLYGKTIRRRSPLTCRHQSGGNVCSVCVGGVADSFQPNINIGVDIAKQFSQDKAQATMSVKHLLSTLVGEAAKLGVNFRKLLSVEDNVYYLQPELVENATRITLEVRRNDVYNLSQLDGVTDVYALIPGKISNFSGVILHIDTEQRTISTEIELSKTGVKCTLSYAVLDMIKNLGVANVATFNDTSCLIDITPLGIRPLFIKPEALPPISEMSKELSKLFERTGDGTSIASDIMGTLGRLHELVQSMGGAHLSIIELLLSAYITRGDTYNLVNGVNGLSDLRQSTAEKLLMNRSLATWLIYSSPAVAFLNNPGTFNIRNRTDSVLDVFIDPVSFMPT